MEKKPRCTYACVRNILISVGNALHHDLLSYLERLSFGVLQVGVKCRWYGLHCPDGVFHAQLLEAPLRRSIIQRQIGPKLSRCHCKILPVIFILRACRKRMFLSNCLQVSIIQVRNARELHMPSCRRVTSFGFIAPEVEIKR